jgi:hypothetical protein
MIDLDKLPTKSKKFIAFFFALLVIAGILVIALLTQTFGWAMVTFMSIGIMAIGALAIGYVLSQASLDKFIRGVVGLSKNTPKLGGEENEDN